jgi:hypothetical protein
VLKRFLVGLSAAALLVTAAPVAEAVPLTPSITLNPNGPIRIEGSDWFGWGYDIQNPTGSEVLFFILGSHILTGGLPVEIDTAIYDFPSVAANGGVAIQPYTGALGLVQIRALYAMPQGTLITGEVYGEFWDLDTGEVGDLITLTFNATVPEPATLLLFGAGLVGVAVRLRRAARA